MALYDELAPWWRVLSPPEAHDETALAILRLVRQAAGDVHSLLELGAGTGPIAANWPDALDVVLVDRSPAMLAVSKRDNPGREHVAADLRTLALGRTFDAVVLHDAVMYMTSPADLAAAFATAAAHLRPGGAFLVVPDGVRETFEERTLAGGTSEPGPGIALLEWHWDPDPDDHTTRVEFVIVIRDEAGSVRTVHETHTLGLFSRATFRALLDDAGFVGVEADPLDAVTVGEVFLARRR